MAKKSRTEILEALARYQRQGFIETDARTLIDVLEDESDRGVAVILGSHIEDALLERILRDLPDMNATERKALTKAGGPLRDAHSRLLMARAMGILNPAEVNALNVFRAMRNACSHSRREISFETPEMVEAFSLVVSADQLQSAGVRQWFIAMAHFFFILLESDRDQAASALNEALAVVLSGRESGTQLASPEKQTHKRSSGPLTHPKD